MKCTRQVRVVEGAGKKEWWSEAKHANSSAFDVKREERR
jgi:hypothetical protein